MGIDLTFRDELSFINLAFCEKRQFINLAFRDFAFAFAFVIWYHIAA